MQAGQLQPMSVLPVPTADEVEQAVALRDPDLVEAAREVDQTLLRWSLGLTPLERLRACTQATSTLERLRHASRDR